MKDVETNRLALRKFNENDYIEMYNNLVVELMLSFKSSILYKNLN